MYSKKTRLFLIRRISIQWCVAFVVVGFLKQVANVILMFAVAVMIYTHYMLGDGLNKTTPLLIFGMLLACRFIVYLQVLLREREEATSQSNDSNKGTDKHVRQRQKDE